MDFLRNEFYNAPVILLLLGLSFLFSKQSHAQDPYSIGVEYGNADEDISTIQLNFDRDISEWFDEQVVHLSSRGVTTDFALTAFYWYHDNNEIFGGSAGYNLNYGIPFLKARGLRPYIEYELGVALISETRVGDRDMSTVFHFKNQLGLGLKMNWGSFFIRASHFSNARLRQPNDGIDILSAGLLLTF